MFGYILGNVWGHSPECFKIFLRMFGNVPRNVWEHFSECCRTFLGVFGDIPRNIWGHSPKIWWHSPEYNISLIPRVLRITGVHYCHLFMYSRKRSPWDWLIESRDNWIFKTLLQINKSTKSIGFGQAKHPLVSNALFELTLIEQGVMK